MITDEGYSNGRNVRDKTTHISFNMHPGCNLECIDMRSIGEDNITVRSKKVEKKQQQQNPSIIFEKKLLIGSHFDCCFFSSELSFFRQPECLLI